MNGLVKVALAGDGLGDYIFGLDPQLLVDSAITILAMFAMFLLLSHLLFNPARDLLEKRQAYIKEQLEKAAKEKQKESAQKVYAKKNKKQAQANGAAQAGPDMNAGADNGSYQSDDVVDGDYKEV